MCKETKTSKLQNGVATPFKIGVIEQNQPLVTNTAIVVLKNNIDGSANLLMEYNQSKIEVRGFKLKNGFTGKNPEYEMKYDELTSALSITSNDGRFQLIGRNQNSAGADGCPYGSVSCFGSECCIG
jgi:hypothetical protein